MTSVRRRSAIRRLRLAPHGQADADATEHIISAKPGKIQGFTHIDKSDAVAADSTFDKANADDYHAVVLPGRFAFPGRCVPGMPHADRSMKPAAGWKHAAADSMIDETAGGIEWLRTLFPC